MYQYGSLTIPEFDDPKVEDYWEAINKASDLSIDDGIYGIWDEQGYLHAIAYQGEVFSK